MKIIKRYHRLIIAIIISTLLYGVFKYNENDIYHWLCVEEDNSASCYIVGDRLLKSGKPELAKNYFQKSCRLEYKLSCESLKELPSETR